MSDIRMAFRQLTRYREFTATVVLTLAVGLGLNASVFLFVSDFFLRPLPVAAPHELAYVFQRSPRFDLPIDFSYPDYLDLRSALAEATDTKAPPFSGLLAFQQLPVALSRTGFPAERTWVAAVSDNFFSTLGVPPARGRVFAEGEGRTLAADPIVVLTDACWRRRFAADPMVIGTDVLVNGLPLSVIGVTPPGFHGPQWSDAVCGFMPATMLPIVQPANREVLTNRGRTAFHLMARLRNRVTIHEAQAAADLALKPLIERYPEVHAPTTAYLLPERMSRPVPKAANFTMTIFTVLVAGALLVLVVAMANVTNLLFARAVVRERELAIRGALGASPWRLLRPLLTESLLMAAIAGGLGLLLAQWATEWLQSKLAVLGDVPPAAEYGADWRVFAFTAGLSLLAGGIPAILPALRAARQDVLPLLKDAASVGTMPRQMLRRALVVGQVAVACVVLVAAGLGVRSAQALAAVEPGFKTDHLLLASYDLGLQRYVLRNGLARAAQFHTDLLDRVSKLPGVVSAGLAERVPLDVDSSMAGDVIAEGQPPGDNSTFQLTPVHAVTPGFLHTMGMALVGGRGLRATDAPNAPPVAIVSEALARRFWPNDNPLGRRIIINGGRPIVVVGIVADGRFVALADPKWPMVFLPLAQNFRGGLTLAVRTQGEPLALAPSLERLMREMEPDLPLFNVRTMEQQIHGSPLGLMPLAFGSAVVSMQGLLALGLALAGLHGLLSFTVARRTREFALRRALGACEGNVFRLVTAQSLRLALVGLSLGLPAALVATRPLGSLLYGIVPTNAAVFAGVSLLVLAVALAASWFPARRAVRVNPIDALRTE